MGILPAGMFSSGEKGQAMYAVTQNGKIAMDNDDLSGQERQIVETLDNHNQLTIGKIVKETSIDRASVTALVATLKNRKILTKVN
jgi:DNA-binding MarR family transcriptional regulator